MSGEGGSKRTKTMFSDENKSSSLAKFLNNYDYVILDTCSLMEDSFPFFMDALVNAKTYLKEDRHLVIYRECLAELKKHSKNKKDDSVRIAAKRAIKIIRAVKWKRIFEFPKKEKNPNFADNIIYVNVSQRRITQKILVITQDRGLAEDLRKLNLLDSQQGRKVSVYRIMNDGMLDVNKGYQAKHNIHRDFDESNGERRERPLFAKTKKVDFDDVLNKVIQGDRRLWANINNPNYPFERKKQDVEQQLSLLRQLPEEKKKTVKLQLNETRLKEELAAAPKPVEIKAPESPKKDEKPIDAPRKEEKVEKTITEEKPTPVPDEKPKNEPSYYGDGLSLEAAITDLGNRSGQLFRDPSIPYVAMIHGPLDLTTSDLSRIAKGLKENPTSYTYKGMNFWSKPAGRGFHVWFRKLEAKAETLVKAEETPAKPVEALSKEVPDKPIEKTEKPASPTPKEEETKAPKKAKEKKSSTAKKSKQTAEKVAEVKKEETPAKPVATLVVAVPDDKEREQIERRARRISEKKTTLKAAEKPVKEKKTKAEKPKEEEKKAAAKTKKTAKTAEKASAPKKEKTTKKAAPKQEKPVKEVKAEAKQKAKPQEKVEKKEDDLAIALKAEARLQSVLSNGNYPKESKLADLKAQAALVAKLKPEDAAKLKYNVATLKMMASMLN